MGRKISGFVIAVAFLSSTPRDITDTQLPERQLLSQPAADPITTDLNDYIWPTAASQRITNIFSEYRRTHFHGGIDIGTRRTTGHAVYAARDGYIARISVNPTGYGKMLWVQHADGYYSTYAHLDRFASPIEVFVRGEQYRLERYPVAIDCKPSNFPVRQGEIIAYTGNTGTGSAHLHFEIRDPKKEFINPLLCKALRYPDDTPPHIRAIAVSPLDEHSAINGSTRPVVVRIAQDRMQEANSSPIFYASGAIGFAVYARDEAEGQPFSTGVYSYQLFVNDSLVYSIVFDRTPSSDDHHVALHYDFDLMEEESGRFEKLYADSPHRLPFVKTAGMHAGVIRADKLAPGRHSLMVVVGDIAGNTSKLNATLIAIPPPEFSISRSATDITFGNAESLARASLHTINLGTKKPVWQERAVLTKQSPFPSLFPLSELKGKGNILRVVAYDSSGTPSFPRFLSLTPNAEWRSYVEVQHTLSGELVHLSISTAGIFTATPSIALLEGEFSRKIRPVAEEYNQYRASFRPLEKVAGTRTLLIECEVNGTMQVVEHRINLYPLVPGQSTRYVFDEGRLVVESHPQSVFKTVYLEVETERTHRGRLYTLSPRNTVFDKGIRITAASEGETTGLYFRGRGSSLRLMNVAEQNGFYTAELKRTLGELAVLHDVEPPEISRLKLPRTRTGSISFRIVDDLSGVEYNDLKLYIDGVLVIPEIDGEHRRVVYQLQQPLTRGSHSLTILMKDRMGNASEVRRAFAVR